MACIWFKISFFSAYIIRMYSQLPTKSVRNVRKENLKNKWKFKTVGRYISLINFFPNKTSEFYTHMYEEELTVGINECGFI